VSHPNDQDKLPGRLQQLNTAENRNAGPVNFIGWFAANADQSNRFCSFGARPDGYSKQLNDPG
jgi:hypothetical protein